MNKSQTKAYRFLLDKFRSSATFTKEEFREATGWSAKTFGTHLSKQFRPLLAEVGGKFRVKALFARFVRESAFYHQVVSQKRRLAVGYKLQEYAKVIVFEFFMPLRNEEHLRSALDALFFRDSVTARLQWLDEGELKQRFPPRAASTPEEYRNQLCDWIAQRFIGYSISHVSGRYRAGQLKARAEAATADRYLVDETTAVVKFILPCSSGKDWPAATAEFPEAECLRWVFFEFFVGSIIELVSGEDEIWLMESGERSRLHVWSAPD